ncbi:hypothetical protein V2O64_03530 [Verrucomicrobiaceae bacterium 227]
MIEERKSKQELFVALLIAAWAHVALFFVFVALLVFDMLSAKVIEDGKEKPKKEREQVEISLVYEEDVVGEVVAPASPVEEPPVEKEAIPVPPPTGFVQTQADQAMEDSPDEPAFIGENNTKATSDAGAEAGDLKVTALAGDEKLKQDVKTFDSNFADGKNDGPQDGSAGLGDGGEGDAAMTQPEALDREKPSEIVDTPLPEPVLEEKMPEPKKDELAALDQALKALDEALVQEKTPMKKVEETLPEKRATKASESGSRDGGFAPKTSKTKVRGVINASGSGSLSVENTPAGRYQAKIYKMLERSWQMENIRNRSLIAPGNISLYFAVDRNGRISNPQQISMNGASGTQWGMIVRALNSITIPKMPKEVIDDLGGDALELIVTFNY